MSHFLLESLNYFSKYLILFVAVLFTNIASSQGQKVSLDGFSYSIDKAPSWVVPKAIPTSEPKESSTWHYALIDEQIKVEAKSHSRYLHVVRRLTSSQGLNEGAQFSIYFNPKYEKLTIHEIVILRQNTKVDVLKRDNIKLLQREERLENNVYDGWVTANILVPGVRKDDAVIYRYTINGSNPVFDGLFAFNYVLSRNLNPSILQSLRVIYPKERKIAYKAHNNNLVLSESLGPVYKEISMLAENIPVAKQLADLPPAEYLNQLVQFSEFDGWASVDVWAAKLFAIDESNSKLLVDKVQGWKNTNNSVEEQAKAALNFIQKDIRYFSVSLGESSHKPSTPDALLNNRYGDCKDKSLFLTSSFKALGLSSRPVLVNSWLGDAVSKMLPSPLAFDHAIVSLDINGSEVWLDPTRSFATGSIKSRAVTTYKTGLKVSNTSNNLVSGPNSKNLPLVFSVTDTFVIGDFSEPVKINAYLEYRDDLAEKINNIWLSNQRDTLEKELIAEYSRRYPSFSQKTKFEFTPEPDVNAVKIKIEGTVPEFFGYPSQQYLSMNLFAWGISNELRQGADTARNLPFYFGAERSVSHAVKVLFPESIAKDGANSSRSVRANHFGFDSSFTLGTNTLEITSKLDVSNPVVDLKEWGEFSIKTREALNLTFREISVAAFALDKSVPLQEAVRKELIQNERQIVTDVQSRQRVRKMILTEHLNGTRLTLKQRNQALLERAIAYSLLGDTANALKDAQLAITKSPDNVEFLSEYAEMQWSSGKFSDALETTQKIKKIGFQNSAFEQDVLYREARILFYLGEYAKAALIWESVASSANGETAVFSAIWMDIAKLRANMKLSDATNLRLGSAFSAEIYKYMRGDINTDDLLKKAQSADGKSKSISNKCEANFFIAMKLLQTGEKSQARKYFQATLDTKVTEFVEYKAASFELEKL
jgi:lipoprotein NlpI